MGTTYVTVLSGCSTASSVWPSWPGWPPFGLSPAFRKLAVRFTDPAGDAIVADGANLWIFLQQAAPGQVIKRPISDQLASPIDIGQFLDAPAAKYEIVARGAEPVGDRPSQAVDLTPKKGVDAPFTKATVWIDEADEMNAEFLPALIEFAGEGYRGAIRADDKEALGGGGPQIGGGGPQVGGGGPQLGGGGAQAGGQPGPIKMRFRHVTELKEDADKK